MTRVTIPGVMILLLVAFPAAGAVIWVGDHPLRPNQEDQLVKVYVTGGEFLEGMRLNAMIGKGGPELELPGATDGPKFKDPERVPPDYDPPAWPPEMFAGTIWETNHEFDWRDDWGYPEPYAYPQVFYGSVLTAMGGGPVQAGGASAAAVLVNFVIDTTGFFADDPNNPWPFELSTTATPVYLPTTLLDPDAEAVDLSVMQGQIRIVSTLNSANTGNWNAAGTWGGSTPTIFHETVVGNHTVTVAEDGEAFSLLTNHSGSKVVVNATKTLSLYDRADITAGAVQIAPGGLLEVDGDLAMQADGEYICQLDSSANGVIGAAGDVYLDGTLTLEPTIGVGVPGDGSVTIVTADGPGGVSGTFADVPTDLFGHLDMGVFYRGINYDPANVSVDLFTAEGGDGNGDAKVDVVDVLNLVANFGTKPGLNTWLDNDTAGGDGRGDGEVDELDVTDLMANFGTVTPDPGPAGPGEITMVPEPATVVMLAAGLLGLLVVLWRRRRTA